MTQGPRRHREHHAAGRLAAASRSSACVGDTVAVEADVFADGHDLVACAVCCTAPTREPNGSASPMSAARQRPLHARSSRVQRARPLPSSPSRRGWITSRPGSRDIAKKQRRRARTSRVDDAARRSSSSERRRGSHEIVVRHEPPLDGRGRIASARASRRWYELFPRSTQRASPVSTALRRLRGASAVRRLDGLRHACTCRRFIRSASPSAKAPNNKLGAAKADVGSPWAIGGADRRPQGHHPELGTLEDFVRLRRQARATSASRSRSTSLSVQPRSPVRAGASGVVLEAPRRHDPVRGESAEEVPGHLPVLLRDAGLARALGGAEERGRLLDRRRACASSASTIRTPSRSRSGSG